MDCSDKKLATDKQKYTMEKHGIPFDENTTLEEARKLIKDGFDAFKNRRPTEKQLAFLIKHRIGFDPNITMSEASNLIASTIGRLKKFSRERQERFKQEAEDYHSDARNERVGRRVVEEDGKLRPRTGFDRVDKHGRLHGHQPSLGQGEVFYVHGSLEYMDDGNGREFFGSDDCDIS